MRAGAAVLNGAGELTGFLQISEWGLIETPVYLTSTMAVGRVFDGAVAAAVAADPAVGVDDVVIPVVGECDDSWLNDARTVQVEAADAGRAVAAATPTTVSEGAVGAGTGMVCFGRKGGIGTSSRVVARAGCTRRRAGAGELRRRSSELRVDGVPVGRLLGRTTSTRGRPAGSCIVVVATDAPLELGPARAARPARRLGLARTGSIAHHGSGEIFVAFATAGRQRGEAPHRVDGTVPDTQLDPLFAAAVDATEEAVLNALWAATDTTGRSGNTAHALPHDEVLELLAASGRLPRTAVVGVGSGGRRCSGL